MLVLSEQLEYFLAMPFSRGSLGLEARVRIDARSKAATGESFGAELFDILVVSH